MFVLEKDQKGRNSILPGKKNVAALFDAGLLFFLFVFAKNGVEQNGSNQHDCYNRKNIIKKIHDSKFKAMPFGLLVKKHLLANFPAQKAGGRL